LSSGGFLVIVIPDRIPDIDTCAAVGLDGEFRDEGAGVDHRLPGSVFVRESNPCQVADANGIAAVRLIWLGCR